ncbi:MAG: hypothetical protein AB8G86_13610 [Saprospiraceae bacterium]
MTKEQIQEQERKQLHIKYFGALENPAIVVHKEDDTYFSKFTNLEIPKEDVSKLGLGLMIEQESPRNSLWD